MAPEVWGGPVLPSRQQEDARALDRILRRNVVDGVKENSLLGCVCAVGTRAIVVVVDQARDEVRGDPNHHPVGYDSQNSDGLQNQSPNTWGDRTPEVNTSPRKTVSNHNSNDSRAPNTSRTLVHTPERKKRYLVRGQKNSPQG